MAQHLDRYKEKYHKNHKIYKSKQDMENIQNK